MLVHAVRYAQDLSYGEIIAGIATRTAGASSSRLSSVAKPIATRCPAAFPTRSATDDSKRGPGLPLTAENAHAMLCGNPDMVRETQAVLETRGMQRHRRREPGHYTVETYW